MSAAATVKTLETPVMDSSYSTLLQNITDEGGYAFASMATLAAGGDTRAAEVAKEMAWEQLHSGPWHSVGPIWRDAYAMACLHVARNHFSSGEFKLSLKALDMGLIMGGLTLRDDLNSCIKKVSNALREEDFYSSTYNNNSSEQGQEKSELFGDQEIVSSQHLNLPEVRSVSLSLSLYKFNFVLNLEMMRVQPIKHGVQGSGRN